MIVSAVSRKLGRQEGQDLGLDLLACISSGRGFLLAKEENDCR